MNGYTMYQNLAVNFKVFICCVYDFQRTTGRRHAVLLPSRTSVCSTPRRLTQCLSPLNWPSLHSASYQPVSGNISWHQEL